MSPFRFVRQERGVRRSHVAVAVLVSLQLPWQSVATGTPQGGAVHAGPFGLGEVVTSDGWRLDLSLALEAHPFDARSGARVVRSGPWRIHARPGPDGVTIVQERVVAPIQARADSTRWFSIRGRFAPLPGRARPAAPVWLGIGSDDHVTLAADAGVRVLTAVGWRPETPADWWPRVSASASAAGAAIRRLEPGNRAGPRPSEWVAIGVDGGQRVILTAHPHRGGTGWVLQSLQERS